MCFLPDLTGPHSTGLKCLFQGLLPFEYLLQPTGVVVAVYIAEGLAVDIGEGLAVDIAEGLAVDIAEGLAVGIAELTVTKHNVFI